MVKFQFKNKIYKYIISFNIDWCHSSISATNTQAHSHHTYEIDQSGSNKDEKDCERQIYIIYAKINSQNGH